jgi:hypothetical protein
MYPSGVTRKIFAAVFLSLACRAIAQTPSTSAYDPLRTFAPLTLPDPVNSYRSANGAPGPMYWQNRADYELHASIDTAAKVLTATEKIAYTNNSPDTLASLWIQMEQNIYRRDARAGAATGGMGARRRSGTNFTEGYVLDSVELQNASVNAKPAPLYKAEYVVTDTRMQVRLAQPLKHGSRIIVHVHYHYAIPGVWGGRTSWGKAQQGEIYDIAQWYPRMAVYDDLHGWDTQPYLGNEFYCEYGHFDFYVTVPANFLVTGSGELVNAKEVLSAGEYTRLQQARASDKTIIIRSPEDATKNATLPPPAATRTWHFAMDNTRDAVFSASPAFVWDAARINLPDHKQALAQSLYPVESVGDAAWSRSTEYLKDAVEHFSARWFPYPYPNAVNVAGFSTGMEYPGVLFDGIPDKGKQLFWVTAHEIGHSWFPMIVGFNERRNAWMDEGFNTFIDIYESDDFEGGVYGPKRDGEYAPGGGEPADEIAKVISDPEAPVLMTRADAIREKYRHPITYFKSAFGLRMLRENILGPQRFDFAFRKFIRDWAFRHPSPSDFFRAMSSEGGEDLDYFWRGWYFNNWTLDLAVTSAKYVDGDAAKGVQVTVENRGELVLSSTLEVILKDGTRTQLAIPAETWIQSGMHTFTLPTSGPVASATVDPAHVVPDVDRTNNTLLVKP